MPQERESFSTGDIILRDDTSYPAGALVVSGYGEDGELLVYPKGGGPEFRIPLSDISRFSRVDDLERVSIYRKGRFAMDGVDGEFDGWWDGECWNGWARPKFEYADAANVIRAVAPGTGRFDAGADCFIAAIADAEEETWSAETITLPDGGSAKVYGIGAGAWIWEEVENR
jgi:hypothetical protein